MKPLTFFHSPPVIRALERAARCAAMPLSVHYVARHEEGTSVFRSGQCAVCKAVSGLPHGAQACRASRTQGAVSAMERGTAAAFVCHMGFGCVSAHALPDAAPGFVLTLGPFCPAEEPRALETAVRRGFEELDAAPEDDLTETLSDIRIVPSSAVPELAHWTVDVLAELWRAADVQAVDDATDEPPYLDELAAQGKRRGRSPFPTPYHANDIAAALLGNDQDRARALVRSVLAESGSGGKRWGIGARRARMLAMAAAVVEACAQAKGAPARPWDRFEVFLKAVQAARSDDQLLAASMQFLGGIKRAAKREAPAVPHDLDELNRRIAARLPGKVTLKEVAAELGQHPTAITHRLQRRLGVSFSEYVGRMRVDAAKDLLRRTRLGAGEVARRVGARDASNFSKLFRKFAGMSPLEYRKQFGRKR